MIEKNGVGQEPGERGVPGGASNGKRTKGKEKLRSPEGVTRETST